MWASRERAAPRCLFSSHVYVVGVFPVAILRAVKEFEVPVVFQSRILVRVTSLNHMKHLLSTKVNSLVSEIPRNYLGKAEDQIQLCVLRP